MQVPQEVDAPRPVGFGHEQRQPPPQQPLPDAAQLLGSAQVELPDNTGRVEGEVAHRREIIEARELGAGVFGFCLGQHQLLKLQLQLYLVGLQLLHQSLYLVGRFVPHGLRHEVAALLGPLAQGHQGLVGGLVEVVVVVVFHSSRPQG